MNDAEAEVVRYIFDSRARGRTLGEIADDLNRQGVAPPRAGAWTIGKVSTVAKTSVYTSGGSGYPGIITGPEIAARPRRRERVRKSLRSFYALNGLVRCANCGRKMEVTRYNHRADDATNPRFVKYRCRTEHCGGPGAFSQAAAVELINPWLIDLLAEPRHHAAAQRDPLDFLTEQAQHLGPWDRRRADDGTARWPSRAHAERAKQNDAVHQSVAATLGRWRSGEWLPEFLRATYVALDLDVRFNADHVMKVACAVGEARFDLNGGSSP